MWLLVAVVVVGVAKGAASQCWEHPSCQELNSESSVMVTLFFFGGLTLLIFMFIFIMLYLWRLQKMFVSSSCQEASSLLHVTL